MNAEKIHGENVYVNLDEVIETVYQCSRDEANDDWIKRWFEPLTNLQTIEIVHCKSCKYRYDDGWLEPRWTCKYKDMRLKDNDFCSYGERTEE